jgi:leucyl/phenylalanyl-tRNA--protein transferase
MSRQSKLPVLLQPGLVEDFPDPRLADSEGLVAIGGDLSCERLLRAYDQGVFPWFNEGIPELWWSPSRRAVLFPRDLHLSRSMRRELRRGRFRTTWNRAFKEVMVACARNRSDGTWIVPSMVAAFTELHRRGHAHSVEVWLEDALVGGIYGVHRGALFAGESMFHTATNASKVALITLVREFAAAGGELLDTQLMTSHLASLGAVTIPRSEYLRRVAALIRRSEVRLPPVGRGDLGGLV